MSEVTYRVSTQNSIMSKPQASEMKPSISWGNCICLPTLVSRQSRRASTLLKQVQNCRSQQQTSQIRTYSKIKDEPNTTSSLYSSDTLVDVKLSHIDTTRRLEALRKQMELENLCCYIVPSEDEHQSEYVTEADERRKFISGFSGSAGIACITRNPLDAGGEAILSTDGRYFNQAGKELDKNWKLVKQGEAPFTWQEWCVRKAKELSQRANGREMKIGIDPKLIRFDQVIQFNKIIRREVSSSDTKDNVEVMLPMCSIYVYCND